MVMFQVEIGTAWHFRPFGSPWGDHPNVAQVVAHARKYFLVKDLMM
jgi:hypothetical protein